MHVMNSNIDSIHLHVRRYINMIRVEVKRGGAYNKYTPEFKAMVARSSRVKIACGSCVMQTKKGPGYTSSGS